MNDATPCTYLVAENKRLREIIIEAYRMVLKTRPLNKTEVGELKEHLRAGVFL